MLSNIDFNPKKTRTFKQILPNKRFQLNIGILCITFQKHVPFKTIVIQCIEA